MLLEIFGEYSVEISHTRHFLGHFNSHLQSKILTEILWGGDKQSDGILKSMITSEKAVFEAKGQTPIISENYWNAIIDTNQGWVVPDTLDERRFFIPTVSSCNVRNSEYFTKLRKSIYEDGGMEAFFFYLLDEVELPVGWRASKVLPRSRHVIEQALHNHEKGDMKWLVEQLKSGDEWIGYNNEEDRRLNRRKVPIFTEDGNVIISKSSMFEAWKLEKIPHSKITNITELTKFLTFHLGKDCFSQVRPRNGPGQRPYSFQIGSISEMKRHLADKVFKVHNYFSDADEIIDNSEENYCP